MNHVSIAIRMITSASASGFMAAKRMVFNYALDSLESHRESNHASTILDYNKLPIEQRAATIGSALKRTFPQLQDYHIYGILGNFWDESQFYTAICNGGQVLQRVKGGAGSVGLAQWDSIDRYINLLGQGVKFAKHNGLQDLLYFVFHPAVQINALKSEFSDPKSYEGQQFQKFLKSSTDAMSATAAWQKHIERPKNMNPSKRQEFTRRLMALNLSFNGN